MSLEVIDISRKEVERWLSAGTLNLHPDSVLHRDITDDYVLVSMFSCFSAHYDANWLPEVACTFDDLHEMEVSARNIEHEELAELHGRYYCCSWEVWHLVDSDDDIDADFDPVVMGALVALNPITETVTSLKEVDNNIQCFYDFDLGKLFAADFDKSDRVWCVFSDYDSNFIKLVDKICEFMLRYDHVETIVTPINKHDNGLYDVAVLCRSRRPMSPKGWYLTLSSAPNCVQWIFTKVEAIHQFLVFSYNSFGGFPYKHYGFSDYDAYLKLAKTFISDNGVKRDWCL